MRYINAKFKFIHSLSKTEPASNNCNLIIVIVGAFVAQLSSARLSEREVSGSIFSDFNVCFDFPLIRLALNICKTEH